jgi:predicted nucleic acid-binding protein
MIIVLDVSASIELLFKKDKFDRYNTMYCQGTWIIAPNLYIPEITNVLWKYYKANMLSHQDCVQYVQDGIDLIDDFIDTKELWKESLSEGIKNNYSIYDMYYLTLARRNDGTIMTNDKKLAVLASEMKIDNIN